MLLLVYISRSSYRLLLKLELLLHFLLKMNLKSKLQVFVAAAPVLGAAKVFSDTPEPGTSTVSATMSEFI